MKLGYNFFCLFLAKFVFVVPFYPKGFGCCNSKIFFVLFIPILRYNKHLRKTRKWSFRISAKKKNVDYNGFNIVLRNRQNVKKKSCFDVFIDFVFSSENGTTAFIVISETGLRLFISFLMLYTLGHLRRWLRQKNYEFLFKTRFSWQEYFIYMDFDLFSS